MSRRQLGCGVQIRPAPSPAALAVNPALWLKEPTDSEVRDAIAQATRILEDLRLARGDSWTPGELSFQVGVLPDGEVLLRATLIIERLD